MAIVSFTNYKRGQTKGGMRAVMRYTMQEKKTLWDDRQLVTGINCQPQTVYSDFLTTKNLYHKTDGVMFFHMVQSFPKGEGVDPVTAHTAALELARYYKGHEVLVCTHTDRDHIHSHFIINSVNFDSGRKLHIAGEQLQELRQLNDQVCLKFNLPVFQQQSRQRKAKSMSTAEYHMAKNGQSKKAQLMYVIRDCMRHASNRDEFIALMESEGHQVRWEKNRRSITYTAPDGWKCRDNKLFEDRFRKENMEYEFAIRADLIHGRAPGEEPSYAYKPTDTTDRDDSSASAQPHRDPVRTPGSHNTAGEATGAVGDSKFVADGVPEPVGREVQFVPHRDTDGQTIEINDAPGANGRTGWESERETFLASKTQTAQSGTAPTGWPRLGSGTVGFGNAASGLVRLGRVVEDDVGSTDDPEEKRRRIEAKIEAENFGAVLGVTIGVVSGIAEHLTQQQQPTEQPEEPEVLDQNEPQDFLWEQTM